MEQPLVSVITITRNRGSLIHRSIESVIGQTYKYIEHIIVDGGSTDNTKEVVGSYINIDNRIKYYCLEENPPIPETIWFGFQHAKGQYITFLDDDDEYLPTKIEKQLSLITSLPEDYGMVYCWMSYYDNDTHKLLKVHKNELRGNVGDKVVDIPRISGTPTYMFKDDVFKKLHGWKSKDEIGIISDWDLGARCCQLCKVDYVPEFLVNVYENHGAQRMSSSGYYNDIWERTLIFHSYMLKQFTEIFNNNPSACWFHYENLIKSHLMLHHYKEALVYYIKLLRIRFSLNNIAIYPYYLIKSIRHGVK